ncbi:GNAT family N-acetyltransferase [Pontimicrobium sp. IMCC45349]|jgi:RimJ/RimL family protein N-acetyltransferase|uniref:GNAT family N-acetyltransferase n=1 Tax=Pontimicrobium sp. IMCC45349 TaxID=3391574 RepID=UPI00399F207B
MKPIENYSITLFDTNKSESFFKLIDDNRVNLEDYFAGTVSRTKTLGATKMYCDVIKSKIIQKKYFPYVIVKDDTQEFVGWIDVKNIDWDTQKAELGYFVDSKHEGKGIVTQSLGTVIDHVVKKYNFKKLLCRVSSTNKGSIAVAVKNGFELEGTIRRDYKTTKGELIDLNYYGRIF